MLEPEWITVPSRPELEVTCCGSVRAKPISMDYYHMGRWGRMSRMVKTTSPKILKHRDNGKGYRCINRKNKTLYVHRLIAETFLPNPDSLPEVNHKDGDKANNHVSNLEWVSKSQNAQHALNVLRRGRWYVKTSIQSSTS